MNRSGRYAPSPTGDLHLGNLRTALLAWLYARSAGAAFRLRIEDLDQARSRQQHEARQIADLRAIGIDWDGEIVRQSERTTLYAAAVARLDTYPCWCSRADIAAAISAPHGRPNVYPGTCRELTSAQRAQRERANRKPALRVRADGEPIEFTDRVYGPQTGEVDDFVVRRNDGAYAYNLAVVVDDGEQGIGEVVRGEDLLNSTARQIWLGDRLSLPRLSYAHVPLVLGTDGSRLAKRHGAVTLADRVALGETPDQVRGRLAASIGLCPEEDRPSPRKLLSAFEPAGLELPRSGPLTGL